MLEVGSIFARVGAKFDDDGFVRFDRAYSKAENLADKPIKARAGLDVDHRGFDNYNRAVRGVNDSHRDLVRGSGRVRTAFGTMFLGGAGFAAGATAVYGLAKGVGAVTNAFIESQKVGLQTNAVIKSTGGEAGVSAKHVGDLANALSRKTGVDDEAIQSSENLLLTFTNLRNEAGKGNDVFDQSTKIVNDMSAALGQDLSSSAIQVGKALNDPVKGITALQRVGVSFTKQQRDQIKGLVEHGKTLDAQKIILRELNKEFGGSAAAVANPLDRLKVTLGNIAEAIGGKLNPYISKAATYLDTLANGFLNGDGKAGKFGGTVRKVVAVVGQVLGTARNVVGAVFGYIGRIIDDNRATFTNLGQTVGRLWRDLSRAFSGIARAIGSVFGGSSGTGRDIRNIISKLLEFAATVAGVYEAVVRRALPGIVTAFRGLAQIIRGVIRIISGVLSGDFGKAWDGVKDIFKGAVKALGGVIRAATAPFRAAISAVGGAIKGAFTSVWGDALRIGAGFVNKIIDVINIIPGVNIKHVGVPGSSSPSSYSGTGGHTGGGRAYARGGREAGGRLMAPVVLMGEEAPEHPEWIIPENPAYRSRALGLWAAAGRALGVQGFNIGGAFGKVGGAIGDVAGAVGGAAADVGKGALSLATSPVRYLLSKLPHLPGGIAGGAWRYARDKAVDFIKSKASSLIPHFGGGESSTTGLVGQVLRALAYARSHGWHGGVISGFRSIAKQQYLYTHPESHPGRPAAPPGSSEHNFGRAVDVSDPAGFERAMTGAPPGSRLYPLAGDPGHFSVSGHAIGGRISRLGGLIVSAFAGGGRNPGKKGAPAPKLPAKENRGLRRSISRGERGILGYERSIQVLERQYGQKDREFGLSEETFLVENDDGSATIDQGAIDKRVGELEDLEKLRTRIRNKIKAYRTALRKLAGVLRQAIGKLEGALGAAKGKARAKERAGYRDAIGRYRQRLTDVRQTYNDLGLDLDDNRIDLLELDDEIAKVKGTTGHAAPTDSSSSSTPDTPADTPAGGLTPDMQAILDQATAVRSAYTALTTNIGQTASVFGGPGDIGSGGVNALAAASFAGVGLPPGMAVDPRTGQAVPTQIVFQSVVPPSPQQVAEAARVVVGGMSYQTYQPATTVQVG